MYVSSIRAVCVRYGVLRGTISYDRQRCQTHVTSLTIFVDLQSPADKILTIKMDDEATLDDLLQELAHDVAKESSSSSGSSSINDRKDTQEIMLAIERQFSAKDVMNRVSSCLLKKVGGMPVSPDEAYHVVVRMATANAARYLKPASCAVRDEALRLETSIETIIIPEGLLPMLVEQVKSTDIQMAQNSIETLVSLYKTCSSATETIVSLVCACLQEARSNLSNQRTEASLCCVRCLTALVCIACVSDSSMVNTERGLRNLVDLLQDDSDPLLQMSILELIEKLATTKPMHEERVGWLYQHAHYVVKLAGGVADVPSDAMLGGFALKVVATFCKLLRPHCSQENTLMHSFLAALHHNVETGEIDRMAFVVAISALASSSDSALDRVMEDEVTRQAWLDMSVAQPKVKAAILISVAEVIEELSISRELAMKLFTVLGSPGGPDATDVLMKLAISPIVEVRVSVYTLLRAVADCLPTGSQVLLSHHGFFDMLMDREKETTKNGREARYEIIKAIIESPVASMLADEIVKRMKDYLHEGPHYVKPMRWDVIEQ